VTPPSRDASGGSSSSRDESESLHPSPDNLAPIRHPAFQLPPADDLPPESRITSRLKGDVLHITVPPASLKAGCLTGSWALCAACGFLAVSSITQGLLTHHPFWSLGGVICFALAGWQLALRRGSFGGGAPVIIEITPDLLCILPNGSSEQPPQVWRRQAVRDIDAAPAASLDRAGLNIHPLGAPSVTLLRSLTPEESRWLAGQIKRKWGFAQ
jgi:hypothetical protein